MPLDHPVFAICDDMNTLNSEHRILATNTLYIARTMVVSTAVRSEGEGAVEGQYVIAAYTPGKYVAPSSAAPPSDRVAHNRLLRLGHNDHQAEHKPF